MQGSPLLPVDPSVPVVLEVPVDPEVLVEPLDPLPWVGKQAPLWAQWVPVGHCSGWEMSLQAPQCWLMQ